MRVPYYFPVFLALILCALPTWAQNIAGVDFIDGPGGAITVTVSSEQPSAEDAIQTINASNMDADYLLSTTVGNGRGQWYSGDPASVGTFIQWDFDQPYKLKDMWLWNANMPGWAHRGIQKADVFVDDGGGYEFLTEYRFDQGPAHGETSSGDPEAPYAHDHYGPGSNEVDLGGRTLTGVRLEMNKPLAPGLPSGEVFLGKGKGFQNCCTGEELEFWATVEDQIGAGSAVTENIDVFGDFSNYGGGACCFVIEEVRFNIIPEPATFGLVLAGIPLLMRRRRA